MSVKILSTVETSCATNPQQIAVMELESYSWRTCSIQPRLVDCRIPASKCALAQRCAIAVVWLANRRMPTLAQ